MGNNGKIVMPFLAWAFQTAYFFLRGVQLCGTRGLYRRKDTIVYCVESKPMATLQGSGPAVYRGVYTHFSFPHLFGECLPDGG